MQSINKKTISRGLSSIRLTPTLIGCLLFVCSTSAFCAGPNPRDNWQTLESTHFRINFRAEDKALATQFASVAESVYPQVTQFFQWQPKDKTEVSLFDYIDETYGIATVVPYNLSSIFLTPPIDGELQTNGDWMRLIFTHEFTHIVHLDKLHGTPSMLQSVFGRHPFLFANRFQPAWFTEGLATYIESYLNPGTGRLGSTLYEAIMRNEVANGLKTLAQINIGGTYLPLNHDYVYGSYFFWFLEENYGRKAILDLVNGFSDNIIPYRIVSNPHAVTGLKLNDLWREYEKWLIDRFQPQIEGIKSMQVKPRQALSQSGYVTGSPVQNAANELFYVEYDGKTYPRIVKLDAQRQRTSYGEVQSSAQLDSHREAGLLIAQPATCDRHSIYSDLFLLSNEKIRSTSEPQPSRLTRCARYRRASWSPDGSQIAAIKQEKGIFKLDLLTASGQFEKTLFESRPGELLGAMDWSPVSQEIIVNRKLSDQWQLFSFNVEDASWRLIRDSNAGQLRYSQDGRKIVYSSLDTHTPQIEILDLDTGHTHTLTAEISGAYSPSGYGEQGLLGYVSMGPNGTDIYQVDLTQSQLPLTSDEQRVAVTSTVFASDLAKKTTHGGESLTTNLESVEELNYEKYWPFYSSSPTYWEPAWMVDNDSASYGFNIAGHDALGIHHYQFELLYEADFEEFSGEVFYVYNQRLFLSAHKDLDYLAKGNDTEFYETNMQYQLMYTFPFTTLSKTWQIGLGYNFERLKTKSLNKTLDANNENLLGIHVFYSNVRQFPLNHFPKMGRSVEFIAETYHWFNREFSGEVYIFDWHEYFPLKHSTVALRYVQGWGTDNPTLFDLGDIFSEPEAGLARINQRDFSLRGYKGNNAIFRGRRLRLGVAEWRIPLRELFTTAMVPPLGLRRMSTTLFAESGAAWNEGGSPERYYASAGIELIGEVVFGYNLQLNTRIGYAHGFADIGEDRVYMGIGRSF